MWAACCLGLFGLLHTGEMTVPSDHEFDPAVHLTRSDIAIDNKVNPRVMQVFLKQSKTICSDKVHAVPRKSRHRDMHGDRSPGICGSRQEGPLFRYQDGRYLTRQRLVTVCWRERA